MKRYSQKQVAYPKEVDFAGRVARIWSGEHGAWYRPDGHGYTADFADAGVFGAIEAQQIIQGLGPEKRISLDVSEDIQIPFSAPMVQSLLAGRKLMTRRLAQRNRWFCACGWRGQPKAKTSNPSGSRTCPKCDGSGGLIMKMAPTLWQKVRPGDRLWVREAWRVTGRHDAVKPRDLPPRTMTVAFAAGGSMGNSEGGWTHDPHYPDCPENAKFLGKLRPGMFLPRWASRLTLDVTAVKMEPLQNISEADAIAEGIEPVDREGYPRGWKSYEHYPDGTPHPHAVAPNKSPVTSFRELWQWLHGHKSWDENPELVAMSFQVRQANIDEMKVAA